LAREKENIMNTHLSTLTDPYIQTVNSHDAAAYQALFAEDAVVDDAGREFVGLAAIKHWSASDIFDAQVTLEVLDEAEQDGEAVITTKVDGNFDRTGLPDPVIIVHRLSIKSDKITRLTCRLAEAM
jgi:hypothetical protein